MQTVLNRKWKYNQDNGYIPSPNRIQNLVCEGYKYILLKSYNRYPVFTMLKIKRKYNDELFELETDSKATLILDKWTFAEHCWDLKRVGWRSTDYGCIKFVFD